MRTYLISNVCKNAPAIFSINVDLTVYATSYNQSQVPQIVTLLQNPNKPFKTYPRYYPVLYKDGVIRESGLFGSATILDVS